MVSPRLSHGYVITRMVYVGCNYSAMPKHWRLFNKRPLMLENRWVISSHHFRRVWFHIYLPIPMPVELNCVSQETLVNTFSDTGSVVWYCQRQCSYPKGYSISQVICTRFRCALLCCGYAIVNDEFTWSIYPYSSGLLCWHWGNR